MIIINRRFNYFNAKLIEKNPKQVNINILIRHIIKKINQRWNDFNGIKIQRDMCSAFLIMNINTDLESFNKIN